MSTLPCSQARVMQDPPTVFSTASFSTAHGCRQQSTHHDLRAQERPSWLASQRPTFWAVADQGVVSLGTFLTNIVLARSLSQSAYGLYSVVLAILVALNVLHGSLIAYPLSTSALPHNGTAHRKRTVGAVWLTFALMSPLILVAPMIGAARGLAVLVNMTVIVSLVWQVQETFRRSLMTELRHKEAIWGDAVSYLGQAVLVALLVKTRWAGLSGVLAVMALTSAAGALLQAIQSGVAVVSPSCVLRQGLSSWDTGRWILGANVAALLSSQTFIWALAVGQGTAAAGSWQAVLNTVGVCHPLLLSVGNLVVPSVSSRFRMAGLLPAWQRAYRIVLPVGIAIAAYLVVLAVQPGYILSLFYGPHSAYAGLGGPVRVAAISYLFVFSVQVFGGFLSAVQEGRRLMRAQFLGALFSLILGAPLSMRFGVIGVCVGFCSVSILKACAIGYQVRRLVASAQAPVLFRAVVQDGSAGKAGA